MSVSVVIPTGGDCPHRAAALRWVIDRYMAEHPDWEIVLADGDTPGGYSRARAIIAGAEQAEGDVLLVADGDVWTDPTKAVKRAARGGWAVPHLHIHRLSRESTELVLAGADWHGLPLSTDSRQDATPYRTNETGTMVAIARDLALDVPPDRRFVGWGDEDEAWASALRKLHGAPWRGREDLVHLWHPPQPRMNRTHGSEEGRRLMERYKRANARGVRKLLEEATRGD